MKTKLIALATLAASSAAYYLKTRWGKQNETRRSPDLQWQGHRGARGLLPENTIASFIKCLDCGVYAFELDVVVSKDKKVVVSHEGWMSHHFASHPDGSPVQEGEAKKLRIYDMPYETVKLFDVGKHGNGKFPSQQALPAHKPLLIEVVEACDQYAADKGLPPVTYNIEIKSFPEGDYEMHPPPSEFARLVLDEVDTPGLRRRSILQSFDPRILRELKKLGCGLKLSLLSDNLVGLDSDIKRLGFVPDCYAPYYRLLTPALVKKAHKMGMEVITWTVNEVGMMRQIADMGVDVIITDYPDLVEAV